MSTRAALLVCVLSVTAASRAVAQVNVEPLRKKVRSEGYSGAVEASVTGRFGNVEGAIASGVGQVGFASKRHLAFLHGRGDYTRLAGRTLVARSFLHVRYNLTLLEQRLHGELFAQTQSDAFLLLRHRELYGVGPRLTILDSDTLDLFAGCAAMFEHERVAVPPGAPDPAVTNLWRGSLYVALNMASDERVSFAVTGFYQPAFARPSDYRVLVEALFNVAVAKHFSVRLYGTVRYDSAPVTTVLRTDGEVRNALAWTF